jgi:hypothetical protein
MKLFHEFQSNLVLVHELDFDIKLVEVYVLVSKSAKVDIEDFNISKTIGEGLLSEWGWKKGEEDHRIQHCIHMFWIQGC